MDGKFEARRSESETSMPKSFKEDGMESRIEKVGTTHPRRAEKIMGWRLGLQLRG